MCRIEFYLDTKIPKEATELNKLTKFPSGYLELSNFKNSYIHKGYFCYNCTCWIDSMEGKHMTVDNDGHGTFGKISQV